MQQNQEIDSFIRWRMVNFMKVDFQATLSKKKWADEAVFFLWNIWNRYTW